MAKDIRRLTAHAALASLVLALLAPLGAQAQSIDYGRLQQLFDEPVTTSATGSPQRVAEVPVDMTIITAADIARSGATDLPLILSRVAGIDVLNWSAGDTDVGVRGYDQVFSPRLLVLINGRQVYLDDFGRTAWTTLPVALAEIRQIEVVRGPNSALFGFNAVGGVINIVTFDPKYDSVHSVEIHGGEHNNVGGSGVQTLRLGDHAWMRLSAGGERQDEWRSAAAYPAPWKLHSLAEMGFQLAPRTELRLEGSWTRAAYAEIVPDYSFRQSRYTTYSLMATMMSDTSYGQIQARAYVNKFTAGSYAEATEFKYRLGVVSLQDLFKIGTRSTVRVALEYRTILGNTTPVEAGNIGYSVIAPSAMWSYAASDRLSLTAAMRLDHLSMKRTGPEPEGFVVNRNSLWDRSFDSFSANFGAVYKLSERETLRVTYARGIQIPSMVEFGTNQAVLFVQGPFKLTIGGNPKLRPSVVGNYELSYERSLPTLDAKTSVKAFYQHTDDVKGVPDFNDPVLATPPAIGAEIIDENASVSDMSGFELAASGKVGGGFHWSADTTYTRVTDKPFSGFDLIGRKIAYYRMTPKFRGNVALGWSNARWAADAYVHFVSAYDAIADFPGRLETTPGYATLGGRVSYLMSKGLTVAVSGQNLGADSQPQGLVSSFRAPRRVIVSLTKTW